MQYLALEQCCFNGLFDSFAQQTGWEQTNFPAPVNQAWTLWTRHSELATLPTYLANKGLKYCDFKVNFDPEFVKRLMDLVRSGWSVKDLSKLQARREDSPLDHEITRIIVVGSKKPGVIKKFFGAEEHSSRLIIDCASRPIQSGCAGGGDIDTACPASIVAQMIANGLIRKSGVLPPEQCVPVKTFFRELGKRGLKISLQTRP